MRSFSFAFLALVAPLAAGCGVREIDPPQAPAAVFPPNVEVRHAPTAPGTTRLVLDANGERASIVDVVSSTSASAYVNGHMGFASASTTVPVCIAPCMADLTPGLHRLAFSSLDDPTEHDEIQVQVGETSKIVRRAMGKYESNFWPHFLAGSVAYAGVTSALVGGIMYSLDASAADGDKKYAGTDKYLLIGGAVALVASIPVMILTRDVHQRGATTELRW
jgi:hypothetical protein